MPQLHETLMGKRLIEGTMPSIARSLERIAKALEKNLGVESTDFPLSQTPADFIDEVYEKRFQVEELVRRDICASMAEARRVVAAGQFGSLLAKSKE